MALNEAGEYEIWDRAGAVIANLRPPLKAGERDAATREWVLES